MATLIRIEEPDPAPARRPEWDAFMSLGFRPLYLLGCTWAAVAVALWIFAPQWLQPPLAGVAWHAHEMLWGFVATIAVGFLMTAHALRDVILTPKKHKRNKTICTYFLDSTLALLK